MMMMRKWHAKLLRDLVEAERATTRHSSMYVLLSHTRYSRVCIVITYSRVWINRVRLPILLVVS